jgi:hypothetical protein
MWITQCSPGFLYRVSKFRVCAVGIVPEHRPNSVCSARDVPLGMAEGTSPASLLAQAASSCARSPSWQMTGQGASLERLSVRASLDDLPNLGSTFHFNTTPTRCVEDGEEEARQAALGAGPCRRLANKLPASGCTCCTAGAAAALSGDE